MRGREGDATGFHEAPRWLRFTRRQRRVWRWRFARAWFALPFVDADKPVGSYDRVRGGERTTIHATRRGVAQGRFLVVPPGEWEQDEADWAIRRGRELAAERGWADVEP